MCDHRCKPNFKTYQSTTWGHPDPRSVLLALSGNRPSSGVCFSRAVHPSRLNLAICDSHCWILHRLIKGSSLRVVHAQTSNIFHAQDRGTSALTQVFHPRILLIRPVAHATPDNNTHMMHSLTSPRGYFRPSAVPWYNMRRYSKQKLCKYRFSDAVHALAFLYQRLSAA